MDELTTEKKVFDRNTADFLRQLKKEEVKRDGSGRVARLVEYVKERYERSIKEAIEKDHKTTYADIRLPRRFRRLANDNNKIVTDALKDKFEPLGFRVSVRGDITCFCPLDFICNNEARVRLFF